MKIVILSDTHIPTYNDKLPAKVFAELSDADLILHAGDIVEMSLIEELKKIAPVKAVQGNMDSLEAKQLLPQKEIITAGKIKIGLVHGWGPPLGLRERVVEAFHGSNVRVIVFGHSHNAINEEINGVLFINPGSPTDKIFAPFKSYAVLEVNGDKIEAKIVKI